jgi:PAT family beta-lactamase induction signal transducer AmpG
MSDEVSPKALGEWRRAIEVYRDRRMLVILLMGFSSGLPLLLTLSTLSYWLAKLGVDKTSIGLFALVGLPYGLKFIWAPIIDNIRLPLLTPLFGFRRSWALFTQAGLIASIWAIGSTDPSVDPWSTALAVFVMAFFSASQDIVIDAYRIEILDDDEQGVGASSTQIGYRIGLLVAGAGAIAASDFVDWSWIFIALSALVLVGTVAVLMAKEPERSETAASLVRKKRRGISRRVLIRLVWLFGVLAIAGAIHFHFNPQHVSGFMTFVIAALVVAGVVLLLLAIAPMGDGKMSIPEKWDAALVAPFGDFVTRRGWALILAFALLYKFGDAIGGVMANPFYVELGFTGVEIASITKVFGVLATVAGVLSGGVLVVRYGILWALVIGGVLQAVTNLLFALQAFIGHDLAMLTVAIGADNFTGGLGSAAFVAYLSSLCNVAFTGTQYALLTSLMAIGRTVLSAGGGWLADHTDWVSFFVLTTALAIPGLVLLAFLMRAYPPDRPAATLAR